MARVYERIERRDYNNFRIRMWCAVSTLEDDIKWSVRRALTEAIRALHGDNGAQDIDGIAEKLSQLSFCNAVEVTSANGNGVVIYPEWP